MAETRSYSTNADKPDFLTYEKHFVGLNNNKSISQIAAHCDACQNRAEEQLKKHPFWIELKHLVIEWDAKYRADTGAESLYKGAFDEQAVLQKKSWKAIYQKTYKKTF